MMQVQNMECVVLIKQISKQKKQTINMHTLAIAKLDFQTLLEQQLLLILQVHGGAHMKQTNQLQLIFDMKSLL